MPISRDKVERISFQVINVLFSRFEKFPEDATNNRNAPFHTAFLKAFDDKFEGKVSDVPFFVSMSSWLHGLNTTLGLTFFENVAHILCDGEKREYTSKKLGNLPIARRQKECASDIITDLSTSKAAPNPSDENARIFVGDSPETVSAIDFSADVFIDDGLEITAIELKSVRPNSGEMRGEKQKILEGKAALYKKFPERQVKFLIGFPFDPTNATSATGYDKGRFLSSIINMKKYFAPGEVLLANELWDFLSGEESTMEQLLEIINKIATTEFLTKYEFINNQNHKREDMEMYKLRLAEWNLDSELKLVNNENVIKKRIENDKKLTRIFNQLVFKGKEYNVDRFTALNELL